MFEEKPECLICGKEPHYCEDCHDNTFHNAHTQLLRGYMNLEDPIKEIKRVLRKDSFENPQEYEIRKGLAFKWFKKGVRLEKVEQNKVFNFDIINEFFYSEWRKDQDFSF